MSQRRWQRRQGERHSAVRAPALRWVPAPFARLLAAVVPAAAILTACASAGDQSSPRAHTPICRDFAGVVEDTVREDAQRVDQGVRNLVRDLQALSSGQEPEAANDQFGGPWPRLYVRLDGFDRAFDGAPAPWYLHDRLRDDIRDLFAVYGFEWVHDEEVAGREDLGERGALRYVDAPLGPNNLGALLLTYGGHSFWTGFSDDSQVTAHVVLSAAFGERMSRRVTWEQTVETGLVQDRQYCTMYYVYRQLLGRADLSTETIYALIMQTVQEQVLPAIIEEAHRAGF